MEMRKLALKAAGIEVYMYLEKGKTEFIWSPPPSQEKPYTEAQVKEIDAKFMPWVRECLRGK